MPTNAERKTFGRERLLPGMYTLNLEATEGLAVKMNGEASLFVHAYVKLRDSKIQQMPEPFSLSTDEYLTDQGKVVIDCEWRVRAVLRPLADLMRQNVDPHEVMWFYYDDDWSRDADECHTFFAVHDGRVVLESCNFSSETPLVLKRVEQEEEPIWHRHSYFDEALTRYWYRKFYTETLTGQLMMLRPDEPILYYYERPQAREFAKAVEFVTLIKMYRLLWVAAALLAAIAFPSIREIMGIAALVLFADILWRCWATRKVGQDS